MYVLMTKDGRFLTPARHATDDPARAALFCEEEAAKNVAPGLLVRELVPVQKCPHGRPFGAGLMVRP